MKISSMRLADKWLGVPMCAALSLARRIGRLVRRRDDSPPRRILFIKLAEQGSTVLANSAFRGAIDRVGRENVYFLCFEENRFVVDVMGLLPRENVLTIRSDGLLRVLVGSLRAIGRARSLRLDTTIDLEFFARSTAITAFLTGARRRVGLHAFGVMGGGEGPYRGNLLTHRVRYNPHLHTSQMFRVLVDALEVDPRVLPTFPRPVTAADETLPRFEPTNGEIATLQAKLRELARADTPRLILLNANCSDLLPLRAWPSQRYVDLAHRLLVEFTDARIAFTGAPAEAAAARELVKQVGSERCFNLAGETTMRELLVLYTLAEVLVTNDSGPAHFAALTPIDVVTLFGPETPLLFAARTPRNHVLRAGLPCSPCVSALNNRTSRCSDNQCMQQISVERVFTEVCRVLKQRERARLVDRVLPTIHVLPAATEAVTASRSSRALTSQ